MKITFRARFRWREDLQHVSESDLNDLFLMFLPTKIEIYKIPETVFGSSRMSFEIKMETKELYTLKQIRETFRKLDILVTDISNVKREFEEEELDQVKKLSAFNILFNETRGDKKC